MDQKNQILFALLRSAIRGTKLTEEELDILVNGCAIGDVLTAVIFRNGQEETITLTVTEYAG